MNADPLTLYGLEEPLISDIYDATASPEDDPNLMQFMSTPLSPTIPLVFDRDLGDGPGPGLAATTGISTNLGKATTFSTLFGADWCDDILLPKVKFPTGDDDDDLLAESTPPRRRESRKRERKEELNDPPTPRRLRLSPAPGPLKRPDRNVGSSKNELKVHSASCNGSAASKRQKTRRSSEKTPSNHARPAMEFKKSNVQAVASPIDTTIFNFPKSSNASTNISTPLSPSSLASRTEPDIPVASEDDTKPAEGIARPSQIEIPIATIAQI
mmetsp:Transcript_8474/g.11995  ORF Transcript_8474/g.11995 Transcript_8474/m.11995 type:complete len:270 (+) Transcript_8474:480-1289(+)|eukprot:CAMPEP_0184490762 /NCGR_PEP_ID=MMETSP0113_2-20130426/18773_1 /TAXON_ID=91329 /ORGANISM="Norrisiella sphaerica, Strain BC52" /LENGTH=269 /DNA_ID=CAMNT_0026874809 /DNA_START=421 /DNA_END=1230 /DNA_ORIENTATION=-